MALARRIYISCPADRWLTPPKNALKWGIVQEIERAGYTPEIFFKNARRPEGDIYASLADKSDSGPIQDTVKRYLEALIGANRNEFTRNLETLQPVSLHRRIHRPHS